MKKKSEYVEPQWIVGIGASAGGLEALSIFLRSLPEEINAAFIITQHLAPHAKSMMVELLGKQTELKVYAIRDGMRPEARKVYIVPPNYDVTISKKGLHLTVAGAETRPKPSVDRFFESLADAIGARAIGIILSGTGSDGAEGMRAIKGAGGITLVQEAKSAKYDGMPNAAVDTGIVDAVLPVEQMGDKLAEIFQLKKGSLPDRELEANREIREIVKLLKRETGTDFTLYKTPTVRRRIEKRMGFKKVTAYDAYLKILQENPEEVVTLAREMLISVTSFFRDRDAYEALSSHVEKIISKKPVGEEIRIWIAGCATGEEAYSIAFLVADICARREVVMNLRMFATDLDQDALAFARTGLYEVSQVDSLPEGFLDRFFVQKRGAYEVRKEIRDHIVFARQDLVQSPPFVKLDLISCRNVLIYFEIPLQNRIFEIFHYSLKPGAVLFLGKSENVPSALFETLNRKAKVFARIGGLSKTLPNLPRYSREGTQIPRRNVPAPPNLAEIAYTEVFRAHEICAFIVDSESGIRHIVGSPTEFIRLTSGAADFRLSNLLPKESAVELAILLKKAAKIDGVARGRIHRAENTMKKPYYFTVAAVSRQLYPDESLFVVTFETKLPAELARVGNSEAIAELSPDDLPSRVVELEQEVSATREHLQTAIEELEISNEELQSLNEELSSTNEELQASNEELETTNEELQSTNEELTTLNEEVTTKTSEVRAANTHLENIQNSIGSPLLVVDTHLQVLRYNGTAKQIFNINPSDLGRPITHLSCNCEITRFGEMLRETVSTGTINEVFCRTSRQIFQMRILPCFDDDKRISGAVIVFHENTALMRAQEKLELSDSRIRSILDGSPTLISLKDSSGRYLTVNRAFLNEFGLKEQEVIGRVDREIFDAATAAKIRDGDLEVVLKRVSIERQETLEIGDQKHVYVCSRFPLFHGEDRNPYAVGSVFLDVTDQVNGENLLRESEARYRAIIEEQAVFVCRHLPDGRLTFVNSAFCAYFGGSPETNQGKDFTAIVDRADRDKVNTVISSLGGENPLTQYEHRVRAQPPLPRRWVRWIHRVLLDENRNVVEYQAVGFDITEIHLQTADLLQKESFFTRVIEHTSDQLTVFRVEKSDFLLESFNQSAIRGRGLDHAALVGKNLLELLSSDREAVTVKRYQECVVTKAVVNFEEVIEAPNGARYLSTTLVPITNDHGGVDRIAAVSRDITRMKRVEEALRVEKRNAELANKAKSDFLAAMSHELRTPLNVITGMSELLARAEIKPEHLRLVSSIQRSGKVLLALIEDVLDLSKIEAGKLTLEAKPLVMEQLISDVLQQFESHAQQKGVRLEKETVPSLSLPVLGDPLRLRQVLMNLVGNAVKFTDRGSIEVYGSERPGDTRGYRRIRLEVRDTGVGIPEEAFDKIFTRFSQADSGTSRKFGGTGLGLAICRQLVELMGGSIGFESIEGQGSKFWFEMQLPEAETSEITSGSESSHTSDLRGVRVLGVDDNPESLSVLKMMLMAEGAEFVGATSAKEALEALAEKAIDVVLMDVQMPEMDGLEATRLIRKMPEAKRYTPVIALTANAMAGDVQLCKSAGMDDYLSKPVDFPSLYRAITKWSKA